MGTLVLRKMRAIILALVFLPAAIAYSSSSSYASGSSSSTPAPTSSSSAAPTSSSSAAPTSSSSAAAPTPPPTPTPTTSNSSSSAAAPTPPIPAPAPTTSASSSAYSSSSSAYGSATQKTIQVVKATLKLPGVSAAAFDASTESGQKLRTAFKNTVAKGLKICGTGGTSQCTGTDVVITGVSRRRADATVAFYVKTASSAAATTGATALNTYVTQGTTFVDNLKTEAATQGVQSAVANVTGVVVTSAPAAGTQSAPTPAPTPPLSAVQARLRSQQVSQHLLVCPCSLCKQREARKPSCSCGTNTETQCALSLNESGHSCLPEKIGKSQWYLPVR